MASASSIRPARFRRRPPHVDPRACLLHRKAFLPRDFERLAQVLRRRRRSRRGRPCAVASAFRAIDSASPVAPRAGRPRSPRPRTPRPPRGAPAACGASPAGTATWRARRSCSPSGRDRGARRASLLLRRPARAGGRSDWLSRSCRVAARPDCGLRRPQIERRLRAPAWRAASPSWSAGVGGAPGAARPPRARSAAPGPRRAPRARARSKSAAPPPKALLALGGGAAPTAAASARRRSPAASQWSAAWEVMWAPRSSSSRRRSRARAPAACRSGPGAGQQVVVDHLAQQGVAEGVALVSDEPPTMWLASASRSASRSTAGSRPDCAATQRVVGGRLAGEPAQHVLRAGESGWTRSIRASRNVGGARRGRRGRQRGARRRTGSDLAARVEALDEVGRGSPGQDALELLGAASSGVQLEQLHPPREGWLASSARGGRSGWRRCSSSARWVPATSRPRCRACAPGSGSRSAWSCPPSARPR